MKKPELSLFAILADLLKMSERQRIAAARLLRQSPEVIEAEAKAARVVLRSQKTQVYMVESRDPTSPESVGVDCIWGDGVEDAKRRTEQHRRQDGEYAVNAQDLLDIVDSLAELLHHARHVRPGKDDDEY